MTTTANNITAMTEIKNHIASINNEVIETAKIALSQANKFDTDKGLASKSDFRNAYSAERDEHKWTFNGQLYFSENRELNFEEKRITKLLEELTNEYNEFKKVRSILVSRCLYDTCTSFFSVSGKMKQLRSQIIAETKNLEEARNWKPEAMIKRSFKKLHGSYVSSTKRNEKMVKGFINRMKLEDELDIKPIDNPFSLKDTTQLIKITGFEYRKPYIIISAINAEDEHDRLTDTRSLDETSEFYFTFNVTPIVGRNGRPMTNPELETLRKWMWNKVPHTDEKVGFATMLNHLVGRICLISTEIDSDDYIGFPTYDVIERITDTSDKSSKAYEGAYCNISYSKRSIDELNGEIRFVRTSNSIDVYTGDRHLRSYHIYGADED